MYLYYKVVLFITFFVTKIVTSAIIQEIFTTDFSVTLEVVEVLKIHRDETVPCGFVIDDIEFEFVLIDYSKPMPEIVAPVDPSLKYLEDSKTDDKYEEEENVVESDKELEL